MRRFRWRSCAFLSVASCFVLTSAASAATVTSVTGSVSINHGSGFIHVSSGTYANPGDRVMASSGGSAEIIYNNGCRERVRPGAIVVVGDSPLCKTAAVPEDHFWIGAGLLAGGIATAIVVLNNNEHHGASP